MFSESDLYGASLGLVAEPWGVTTHAVRLTTVFLCANYFIGGALRLRLVTSQGPARVVVVVRSVPAPSLERSESVSSTTSSGKTVYYVDKTVLEDEGWECLALASVLQHASKADFWLSHPWQLVRAISCATSAQKYCSSTAATTPAVYAIAATAQ